MTRDEFIEEINSWYGLKEFCYDHDCEYCDDIYDEDQRDSEIDSELTDWAADAYHWQDLLDSLQGIPSGYNFYYRDLYGEWSGTDDGDTLFEGYKDDVLEYMDDNALWEEPDEDEEEVVAEEEYDPEDEGVVEEEMIPIDDFFTACSSDLFKINDDKISKEKASQEERDKAFDDFCINIGVTTI